VLWNTGRKHYEALLQLPVLALAVPAWWLFAPGGLRAAAVVSALAIVARALVIIGACLRALDLRWRAIAPFAARGLALAALGGGAAVAGQQLAAGSPQPAVALAAGSLSALMALLALLAARPQVLGPEATGALVRMFPSLQTRLTARTAAVADGEVPR
jgi:hypothetical protein